MMGEERRDGGRIDLKIFGAQNGEEK